MKWQDMTGVERAKIFFSLILFLAAIAILALAFTSPIRALKTQNSSVTSTVPPEVKA